MTLSDSGLPEIPNHVLAQILLDDPALWDATIFGQEVPDFHAHIWEFLADEEISNLVIELPAGHAKTNLVSKKFPIFSFCRNPNERICILQKGIDQAKRVVAAQQREMVHNELLNTLYGPFKPNREQEGYPWSTTTYRISTNTDRHQETNSCHAYGWSSTDVMGGRYTIFLGDDFVTTDNSDSAEKRAKMADKEQTEWMPTLVGARIAPRYILMGTPMFFNDAFEEKRKLTSDYLGPEDWRRPHEVDKSGFVFIRRSAEKPHPKRPGQTLWPAQKDWKALEFEKKKGYINYLRRYCCKVSDSTTAIFSEKAINGGFDEETKIHYPGCKDYERNIGDFPPGLKVVCGADPSSGKKTGASAQFAHITIGYDKTNDVIYIVDFFTGPIAATHASDKTAPKDKESQVGTIITRHKRYGATVSVIESNAQQHAWVDMVKSNDRTVRVKPHHTGRNKHDKDVGVDSMAGYFESGNIRIPYGNSETQRIMDDLIIQLIRYPNGDYTDGVMALWFAVFQVRKKGEAKFLDFDNFRKSAGQLVGKGQR